ncbi:MAG: hypothetical protein ABID54_14270 [Pseudomonadota bacterium]
MGDNLFGRVHLQWFADAQAAPSPGFGPPEDEPEYEVEIVDEKEKETAPAPPPVKEEEGPTRAEILEQLKFSQTELKSIQERLATQRPVEESTREQPSITPQKPSESDADFAQRVKESLYENPASVINEIVMKSINQQVAPLAQALIKQGVTTSKNLLLLDEGKRSFYKKFGKEIEDEVKLLDPIGQLDDPYGKAFASVRSRHFDDILTDEVERRVQEEIAKRLPAKEEEVSKAPVPTFSETGLNQPVGPKTAKVKVTLTPQEARTADIKGIDRVEYARHLDRKRKAGIE